MKHTKYKFEDGEWWYYGQADGRRRLKSHQAKNKNRMFVGGKYVPTSAEFHLSGNYKTLTDAAFSNVEDKIQPTKEGDIYIITNKAWKNWIKVGCAIDAVDRCKSFQTSSPLRDYKLEYKKKVEDRHLTEQIVHSRLKSDFESRNEWFKVDKDKAKRYIREAAKHGEQIKEAMHEDT